MHRFKVGDKVICNAKANERYSCTKQYSEGKILEVMNSDTVLIEFNKITGDRCLGSPEFYIDLIYIDLLEKHVKIVKPYAVASFLNSLNAKKV